MSTFKVQPVYGELIMGWLDATCGSMAILDEVDVLSSIHWQFKGGTLGDYAMKFPSDSSGTRFPNGLSLDIAKLDYDHPERVAIRELLSVRRSDRARRLNSHADWTYSYCMTKAAAVEIREETKSPVVTYTGLHAVYMVARRLWDDSEHAAPVRTWDSLVSYMRECTAASAAGSLIHVPDALAAQKRACAALSASRVPAMMRILHEVDALMARTGAMEARQRARCNGRALMAGAEPADVANELPAPRATVSRFTFSVLHGCATARCADNLIALSRSDMVRLHQFTMGLCSGMVATICQAAVAPGAERCQLGRLIEALNRQVQRLLDASEAVPPGDEVQVCKGFKRAFTYFLGKLAGPLSAVEAEALWQETLETPYVAEEALRGWVAECSGWSAGTAFNLGKLYKLCPAPDASPAMTLLDRHKMVTNRNSAVPEALAEFKTVLRDQILRAYIRKPGVRLECRGGIIPPTWLPAYKAGRFDEVPTSSIHDNLVWEGTAEMPRRSPDDPAVWKDSGLGWDSWDEAIDPERDRNKGNMLLRMMTDSAAPMPGVPHMRGPHDHKIDTKPEGHKDPARGIYSGNLADRLDQSWMEVAVEEVSRCHPAFMIGADSATREERVRAIVNRNVHARECDVFYSFDISGWSPNMDPDIQEASHAVWAQLYDSDLFRSAAAINFAARLYMNKNGFRGWFRNTGANLEGYNGKEMTMVLIALMARAVAVWRRDIVARELCTRLEAGKWAAVLLAYIDDGLAKLTLPRDRAEELFGRFQVCTVRAFSDCGFSVEVAKCFPSDRFAIFLNEPYLAGRHVVHGTRAAMTICAENTEQHTSLVERVTAVSTGCRGAVMSGLDALAGTFLQAYHVFQHIAEWIRTPSPVAAAIWTFAPRCWGGLGLPTALQLGTSGGGAASEEGALTMQRWASISTACRQFYLNCCRAEMRRRTAMGTVMSPLGGRLEAGPMVESRIPDAVRAGLVKLRASGKLSRMARSFLSYSSSAAMEEFCTRVLPAGAPSAIQEQVLQDVASTHPHSLFSAFARRVEKSSTLVSLVGPKEMRRIIRANRTDAVESYQVAKRRCIS